ncbi:GNAT family N-acetyltransferase [Flaviaesturariibacter aridisoli]|uniref:GNAT family N-acetyltransferase n=1 Tax=Flaviaesturariibacter aridisoli TaxID=2545761 RepID=A0A4R4E5P3_9BACT|nr:GNAT family N-acetyltransferase [Flaviaesturariibacter aridisoli]TCZ74966.1 GNAT family N-acetyltransferase [Flaviaesturariibacter aridisoli]
MHPLLHNPVYEALLSGDARLGTRRGNVAFFDADVSPFVGFPEGHETGFEELRRYLPAGRKVLYARTEPIPLPAGWRLGAYLEGRQFVFEGVAAEPDPRITLVPLRAEHVPEMIALTALTRPGPFDRRTIAFGHYYGVFEDGRLASMAGQRLHPTGYSEISAVCTHPDFLGRGYAAALLQLQLVLMRDAGTTPFLHVRADNDRAIALYERLGFRASRPMHFYFMEREV